MVVHRDCRYFRGDIPCSPHKSEGVHCDGCPHYTPRKENVLIIKLGAIGDVIRTTPLLHRLREQYPAASIWWLTRYPEVLPADVDRPLAFSLEASLLLQATEFDLILNLDKDPEACALTSLLQAPDRRGFILESGKPAPIDKHAHHKYLTGLFDDVNRRNTKSYPQEIFEICGWKFQGEEYILDIDRDAVQDIPSGGRPVIGLNTGCGGRWVSRLWPEEQWEALITELKDRGWFPILLGGGQEHDKNQRLANRTGAYYAGHFPLKQFIALMQSCDVVVTGVTMAMHIAIGLRKPLVLFVNIFNPHEFELYGRGEIVAPAKPCTCFFQPACTNTDYTCMEHLSVDQVINAVSTWVKAPVTK